MFIVNLSSKYLHLLLNKLISEYLESGCSTIQISNIPAMSAYGVYISQLVPIMKVLRRQHDLVNQLLQCICVTNDHGYVPFVVITIRSFPHPGPSTGFATRITRLVPHLEQVYNYEFWLSLCKIVRSSVILLLPLFTLLEHRSSLLVLVGFALLDR